MGISLCMLFVTLQFAPEITCSNTIKSQPFHYFENKFAKSINIIMCYHTPGLLGNFQLTVTFSLYIYLQDLQIFSFSVNNITEKLMKVSASFCFFFQYFFGYSKLTIEPSHVCEKQREGHHGRKKVLKGYGWCPTIENQLWQPVEMWCGLTWFLNC